MLEISFTIVALKYITFERVSHENKVFFNIWPNNWRS